MQRCCAIPSRLPLLAAAAFGQTIITTSPPAVPKGSRQGPSHGSAIFQPPRFVPRPIVGAPYYGEEISEHVQTLANGVHINRTLTLRKTWRDSQGRTRTESPLGKFASSWRDVPTVIQITDPVAGYIYTLDSEKKVAHRVATPPPPGGPRSVKPARTANRVAVRTGTAGSVSGEHAVQPTSGPQGSQVITEELGTRTIEGILVGGLRTSDSRCSRRPTTRAPA